VDQFERKLLAKISISAEMEIKTGLHIGAAEGAMHVGGIDKSVVRDPLTQHPYVPGSSLRGKLRSLLERSREGERIGGGQLSYNREGGSDTRRHECDKRTDALGCPVCRLFGSAGKGRDGSNHPSRLVVRDAFLTEESVKKLERLSSGTFMTEWKFENAIDRITSAANPRQLERIPKGARYNVELVYAVEREAEHDVSATANEDLKNLLEVLSLLELDALGGHGARGYGKVVLENVTLSPQSIDGKTSAPIECESIREISSAENAIRKAVEHALALAAS
jgi:CRISPR-associated protein Csm3